MNRIVKAHRTSRKFGLMESQNSGIVDIGFIIGGGIVLTKICWISILCYQLYELYRNKDMAFSAISVLDVLKYCAKYKLAYATSPFFGILGSISLHYVASMFLHLFIRNMIE